MKLLPLQLPAFTTQNVASVYLAKKQRQPFIQNFMTAAPAANAHEAAARIGHEPETS